MTIYNETRNEPFTDYGYFRITWEEDKKDYDLLEAFGTASDRPKEWSIDRYCGVLLGEAWPLDHELRIKPPPELSGSAGSDYRKAVDMALDRLGWKPEYENFWQVNDNYDEKTGEIVLKFGGYSVLKAGLEQHYDDDLRYFYPASGHLPHNPANWKSIDPATLEDTPFNLDVRYTIQDWIRREKCGSDWVYMYCTVELCTTQGGVVVIEESISGVASDEDNEEKTRYELDVIADVKASAFKGLPSQIQRLQELYLQIEKEEVPDGVTA